MTRHRSTLSVALKLTLVYVSLSFGLVGSQSMAEENPTYFKRYDSYYGFSPGEPISEYVTPPPRRGTRSLGLELDEPDAGFCALWNPEFVYSGHRCCRPVEGKRLIRQQCAPGRRRASLCSEMTPDQRRKVESAQASFANPSGEDVLSIIAREMGQRGRQAVCTSVNGFLAWGRPVLPSAQNRLVITKPDRCTQFGTDGLVGMLEWVGRRVAKTYPQSNLKIGDLSGPRGGCLPGFSGRRGHTSHTNGLDADIGFLALKERPEDLRRFAYSFEPAPNWWLIQQFFQNPFACVKIIFVDRRHIRAIEKEVRKRGEWDEWVRLRRFVRHMRGHRHHFHVRVGDGPGVPGCASDPRPELEYEIDLNEEDSDTGSGGAEND